MDVPDIIACLARFDAIGAPPRPRAILLQYRGHGGSCAWDAQADDGVWYVVKGQNNPQETGPRAPGQPLKIVTTELICGRLGQLFSPPVCPAATIVEIPAQLAAASLYPGNNVAITAGPSVGSSLVAGVIDTKFGGPVGVVPPEHMARVVVFQTWLRGEDPAALISLDGSFALSIDHGWYLTGSQWNEAALGETAVLAPVTAQWPRDCLQEPSLYQVALAELASLPEEAIIQQFAGIPPQWGGSTTFMARLADFVLRRRGTVEQAIATLYKGAA